MDSVRPEPNRSERGSELLNNKGKKGQRAAAYLLSAALFIFYLMMLVRSMNPRTTDDYRMRYLEEGYFWEEHEQ